MNGMIDNLRYASTTVQALAVTAGGLLGVFLTLGFFYLLIFLANKTAK
jgi:hypothetical protein